MKSTQPEPVLVTINGAAADSHIAANVALSDHTTLSMDPFDLGVTRGDGIFESIGVLEGRPQELEAHLKRLARSARMLDMPKLRLDAFANAVSLAISHHAAVPELLVKAFVTRGPEHRNELTAWIHATQGPDYSKTRSEGIAVVTLDRGYPRDIATTAPWLLQGAKTLSYAVNRAALREAARRAAEDVIFLSNDGYVLEGPASTVIIRDANGFRTPPAEDGVLPGTTQARLFAELSNAGYATSIEPLREADLRGAEAIWLVSSGRMVAPVHTLDGTSVQIDAGLTRQLLAYLTSESCILYT